jgi:lactate dehydrogenase-like 2-hydroxyacid dehydrogenase
MNHSLGIIGAGRLGQAMARTALRAGRRVVIANSRGPESLASVVSALGDGVSARRTRQLRPASSSSPCPRTACPKPSKGLSWSGHVVIDAA